MTEYTENKNTFQAKGYIMINQSYIQNSMHVLSVHMNINHVHVPTHTKCSYDVPARLSEKLFELVDLSRNCAKGLTFPYDWSIDPLCLDFAYLFRNSEVSLFL